jgi:hypothetical protein
MKAEVSVSAGRLAREAAGCAVNYFDQLNQEKLTRYFVKRLTRLGHRVTSNRVRPQLKSVSGELWLGDGGFRPEIDTSDGFDEESRPRTIWSLSNGLLWRSRI